MISPPVLSAALGRIRGAFEAAIPLSVAACVVPAGDRRLWLAIDDRVSATSIVVHDDDLPVPLRLPVAVVRFVEPLSGPAGREWVDSRLRTLREVRTLLVAPFGDGGAIWIGCDSQACDRDALEALAIRVAKEALTEGGEPAAAREDRLVRIDRLSDSLRALSAALDVRTVFGQLSAIAQSVLPHDAAVVVVRTEDVRRLRLHALNVPHGWTLPDVLDNPNPDSLVEPWDFAVHRDLTAHPVERNGLACRLGLRSTIRVPIWLDGRIHGVLDFTSFAPGRYDVGDVPVARRVAAYVTLALSHQRLADNARRAEEARVRAANLEMLDGLLKTLADVLDVREVFDRVSKISDKVMTHDAMSISMPAGRGRLRVHVATGAMAHLEGVEMAVPARLASKSDWDHERVDDLSLDPDLADSPSARAGMRSMLSVPVRVEGRLAAAANFFSRTPANFTADDVLVARRIADHIALALSHQRLAEQARVSVELRARADNLALLDGLLSTFPDASGVFDLFDRMSGVAKRVLAHDAVLLPLVEADGKRARLFARGGADAAQFPDVVALPESMRRSDWEYDLVADLQADPVERVQDAATRGYRSALRVPVRMDGQLAGALVFLAIAPGAYQHADVQVARRIADRVALLLARERRKEAAKRAEEAESRAARLEARVRALTEELDDRGGYKRVVGTSEPWRHVLRQATQVAETETTVLLLGESGTGKEVVARFVHRASARRDGPFVALNCAALPDQLLEAELFGYERGAFTGATQSKPGQLEQASGGTLFLDEIGEMSLPAQAKFLRVLQEREFQRLGGTRVLRTDARVVAATNRDLPRAIANGTFREDLFYRLNVFAIALPPLRDRRDDIVALSDVFLAEIARGLGRPPSGLSRETRQMLVEYRWPGNVRELRNMLERAAILCDGGLITPDHLALAPAPAVEPAPFVPADAPVAAPEAPDEPSDIKSMERALIHQALQQARFNKSRAAKSLGLTRAQLYVRMRRYGLE